MIRAILIASVVCAVMLVGTVDDVRAQSYPSKPIHFVVPFAPGGPADVLARLIGQKLTEAWGQPVVIDNRPGAGGTIGVEAVAKAAPDGYTILSNNITDTINHTLYKNLRYDLLKDFAAVTVMAKTPFVLMVHPSVPAKSLKEFIALARSKPGQLNYGSGGSGTAGHLAMEVLKTTAGIDVVHIPYKGQAPSVTALLAGDVSVSFTNPIVALPHLKAGKLIALAVSTAQRSMLLPDVPTVAEAGLPGFAVDPWFGVLAPAGTPREIITKLNAEIVKSLHLPDIQKRLLALGAEPVGNTPEEFGAYLKAETERWAKVVKFSGARVD